MRIERRIKSVGFKNSYLGVFGVLVHEGFHVARRWAGRLAVLRVAALGAKKRLPKEREEGERGKKQKKQKNKKRVK